MQEFIYRGLRWGYRFEQWLKRTWTPLGLGLIAIAIIAGLVGIWSAQSMSHMVFFMALFLLAIAWCWSQFIHFDYKATRSLPRFGTVGEPLQYKVNVRNLTSTVQRGLLWRDSVVPEFPRFREFLAFRDRNLSGWSTLSNWPTYLSQRRRAIAPLLRIPPLSPQGKTELQGDILPLRRGMLNLRGITVSCPDPLGLSYQRQTFALAQAICILPRRYQLPPLNLQVARQNSMGENVLTQALGESLEFRSLRDYRPGDPTNKIHWKSWAKVGKPIVKEQHQESNLRHGLIIDTCPQADGEAQFEEVLAIATSMLIENVSRAALLDVMFMAQQARQMTVGQGLRQRAQLLEQLATLEPNHSAQFDDLLPMIQSRVSRLSGCICLFTHWDERRQDLVGQLAQQQIPTQVYVLTLVPQTFVIDPAYAHYCRIDGVALGQVQEDLWQ